MTKSEKKERKKEELASARPVCFAAGKNSLLVCFRKTRYNAYYNSSNQILDSCNMLFGSSLEVAIFGDVCTHGLLYSVGWLPDRATDRAAYKKLKVQKMTGITGLFEP